MGKNLVVIGNGMVGHKFLEPFVPPVKGQNTEGTFVYRTIEDLEAIANYGKNCKVGVVVGGGLLGLECAML
jgi:nitrite reductase (NADH) large subunit